MGVKGEVISEWFSQRKETHTDNQKVYDKNKVCKKEISKSVIIPLKFWSILIGSKNALWPL